MKTRALSVLLVSAGCAARTPAPDKGPPPEVHAAAPHPLDPLDEKELASAVEILKAEGKLTEGVLFPILVLNEPPKEELLAHREGAPFRREAFAVLLDRKAQKTFEAVVDLRKKGLASWRDVPGVQPAVLIEEFDSPKEIVRKDPRFVEAMKKRGITDLENVQIDTWAAGLLSPDERGTGLRLLRALFYYRGPNGKNPYYRPIEGVVATVDLAGERVLDLIDTGVVPVVKESGELDEGSLGPLRRDLRPLEIVQSRGRSFEIHGHEVRWQKWRFHFSMHPREGVVIHSVRYDDAGSERSVLHRASLSEMLVPYGDPDKTWVWRNAFDVGEYGVGRLANTLKLGLDVPDNAVLVDATFADDFGKPYVQSGAIAIYERDAGILWKHFDFDTSHDETRRERQLVISYVTTIGNYDYGLSWVFTQHGAIHVEAELTGIMLPKGVSAEKSAGKSGTGPERFGRMVNAHTVAPNHQHFFNFRLDFDVDGAKNALVQLDNRALPRSEENKLANAFTLEETRRKTEREATSDMDMHTHRSWRVVSSDKTNAIGHPTAYLLSPGHNSMPYVAEDTEVRARSGFVNHHLWVTKYKGGETNAAGYYPNQSTKSSGLPTWTEDDEPIDGEDLVIWYTFGITHNPRPEEWPVMPSHRAGFSLLPDGFFSRNPALDVPVRSE
jgi:primary-amine oxidase